jgi:hypothetical protein
MGLCLWMKLEMGRERNHRCDEDRRGAGDQAPAWRAGEVRIVNRERMLEARGGVSGRKG